MDEDPIVAFARDFSEGDKQIVAAAERFVANPPTDAETLGFHESEKLPPRTRAFHATVNLLADKGKLIASKDKYSPEFVRYLVQEGLVKLAELPPAARAVFKPFDDLDAVSGQPADLRRYLTQLWDNYGQATQVLEDHLARWGKVLLSVDATDGDTMFFALVSPPVAERWRDRALGERPGYESGVRSPMWDRYWTHLTYAIAPDEPERPGFPPGTRVRIKDLPAAE